MFEDYKGHVEDLMLKITINQISYFSQESEFNEMILISKMSVMIIL